MLDLVQKNLAVVAEIEQGVSFKRKLSFKSSKCTMYLCVESGDTKCIPSFIGR